MADGGIEPVQKRGPPRSHFAQSRFLSLRETVVCCTGGSRLTAENMSACEQLYFLGPLCVCDAA